MIPFSRLLATLSLFALAGCMGTSTASRVAPASMPVVTPVVAAAPIVTPAQTNAVALSGTSVSEFVDSRALAMLDEKSRADASTAQYNALQFGRPGAPRSWTGAKGLSGQITVGPYVRVNSLDCRDFTHTVTAGGNSYARKGTACRELDGRWTTVAG